jgi:hypothetical protein
MCGLGGYNAIINVGGRSSLFFLETEFEFDFISVFISGPNFRKFFLNIYFVVQTLWTLKTVFEREQYRMKYMKSHHLGINHKPVSFIQCIMFALKNMFIGIASSSSPHCNHSPFIHILMLNLHHVQ